MAVIIETNRLIIREFLADDAEGIFELNSNADVMKYTGAPLMQNIAQATDFIANYKEYDLYGYGSWACIEKATANFIGAFGLRYLPQKSTTGMGGLFLPQFWGKGYATEVAQACINYGFEKLGLDEIIALAAEDNKASVTVMKRLGMEPFEEINNNGVKVLCYKIKNGDNE
jgi:RimJ/RimL family protein N-acetyltransferase